MSPVLLPVGLLIGVSLGALGGGGSILTVPVLVYVGGQDAHHATTASLLIVGGTSLIALIPHARRGNVRLMQGMAFGALGIAGSFVGSAASSHAAPAVLLTAFAALMLLVAVLMLRRSTRAGGNLPEQGGTPEPMLTLRPLSCACPLVAKTVITATAVGLLTGFFGVGGGFALVPALVLVLSSPVPVAVGTSLLVIAVNSATALLARVGGGIDVDWVVVGLFTAVAVAGSLVGGRLTTRLPARHLTAAFAVLLGVVAVGSAVASAPQLL